MSAMLVRVGIAVTCPVAALTFSQLDAKSALRDRGTCCALNPVSIFSSATSLESRLLQMLVVLVLVF